MSYYVDETRYIKENGCDTHMPITEQELKEAVLNSADQLDLAINYTIKRTIGEHQAYPDTITFEKVGCLGEYFFRALVKLKEAHDARLDNIKIIVDRKKLEQGDSDVQYILEHADAVIECAFYMYESRDITLNIKTPGIYNLDDETYPIDITDNLAYDKQNKKLIFISK